MYRTRARIVSHNPDAKTIKKFDKSLVREFNEKCDPPIIQHICLNNEIFIVLLKAVHVNILKCIGRSAVLHVSIWCLSPTHIYIIYSSLNKLGKGIAKYLVLSLVSVAYNFKQHIKNTDLTSLGEKNVKRRTGIFIRFQK